MTKIALLVSDLDRSRRFYQGLGFHVLHNDGERATVVLGGQALELRSDAEAAAGPHYFTPEIDRFPRGTGVEIAFEVADVDRLADLARTLDLDVVVAAPRGHPDGELQLSDPDGYLLRFAAAAEPEERAGSVPSGRGRAGTTR